MRPKQALGNQAVLHRFPTVIAAIGGLGLVALGAWAFVDSESFFTAVARFEPYNQHFLQDIGAFQLGLGAVLLLAVAITGGDALAVALLGTGVGASFHAASHVIGADLGGNPSTDIPTFITLAVLLLVAGVLRWHGTR